MSFDPQICRSCKSSLVPEIPFCTACGVLWSSDVSDIECENHGEVSAVGMCVVCGKPVCGDCAISLNGKLFCDHLEHQKIPSEWEVLCSTDFAFEADLIERNLQQAGFECKVFSLLDHVGTYWATKRRLTNVLVKKDRLSVALTLLKELRLLPNESRQ
ncbi:MAG TPA: hypothetical protein VNN76_04410 [Bacteroidota bacterium]|nr:hypothetical protein [Bacteroidota bacterium]